MNSATCSKSFCLHQTNKSIPIALNVVRNYQGPTEIHKSSDLLRNIKEVNCRVKIRNMEPELILPCTMDSH